jgi:integrase
VDIDCSAATRAKLIVCLSGIYRRARRVWGITYNPVEDVERPQIRPTFEVNVYTPAEVLALVTAADNDQGRAVLLTAAFTGLRLGELVALRWRDVDLERRVVRVCGSWSGTELTLPKNGRVRSVPLAPQVINALSRLRGATKVPNDLVFVGEHGDSVQAISRHATEIEEADVVYALTQE